MVVEADGLEVLDADDFPHGALVEQAPHQPGVRRVASDVRDGRDHAGALRGLGRPIPGKAAHQPRRALRARRTALRRPPATSAPSGRLVSTR